MRIKYAIIYNMKPLILKKSSILKHLAQRYVWWNTSEWAIAHADILIANVMNLGNWDDIQTLRKEVGDEILKTVLQRSPAGYFTYRSWDYWHIKFQINPIPSLPTRKL